MALALAGSFSIIVAGPPENLTKGKYSDRLYGMRFVSVSAGAGIWYRSLQPGAVRHSMPYSVFVEYGRTSMNFSLIAGTTFMTEFGVDKFILNPNNFIFGAQFAPLRHEQGRFNIYGMAGINICYSRFTEDVYPGIVSYEYKVEKKVNPGLAAGLALGYRKGDFEIRPCMLMMTGNAEFYAGHFTPQKFSTVSLQLHLQVNYRFVFNRNRSSCPVYRKFISF